MRSSCLACSIACKCRWLSSSAIDGAARDAVAANDGDGSFERGEDKLVVCGLVGDEKKPPEILCFQKKSSKKEYPNETVHIM